MRWNSCSISLSILLAGGSLLSAAPAAVQETSSVSLVEVPVSVFDRDGKAVHGLSVADFELKDDGKSVPIQAVDVTEFANAKSAGAPTFAQAPVNAAARRRFLLLFDLSFSSPSRIIRIREAARNFVQKQLGPDDLAAVATFSIEHGLNLVITFTPDRAQLASAVDTLGVVNVTEKSADPLQLTSTTPKLWDVVDETGSQAGVVQGGGKAEGAGKQAERAEIRAEDLRETTRSVKQGDEAYRRGRVTQLLQSFGSLAKALDSVEGHKQLIYFSQGFDMRLLQGNAQDSAATQEQNENAAHGAIWNIDSQARFGNSGLQSALNDMLDLFKRSDCTVHAVDLSGLTAGGDQGSSDPSAGSGQAALFAIAEGTGGELFKNANDFSQQLDRLLEEQSVVYVLTFSPRLTGHPEKFHSLKVRVNRPGVRVSARAGYSEPKPFSKVSLVERKLTAADVIASNLPSSGIKAQVLTSTFPGSAAARVPVLVHVTQQEVARIAQGSKVPLEIYGYAFDSHGRILDFFAQTMTLDLAQVQTHLDSGGLFYYAQLLLPPGDFQLKTLVRDGSTGVSGLSIDSLHVPDYSQKKPYLLSPLSLGPLERGLFIRGHSARSGSAAPDDYPFMAGSDAYLPELSPTVKPDSTLRLCLYAYNFETTDNAGKLQLGGQVLSSDGKPIGGASLVLASRSSQDASGRSTYLVDFKPAALAPGSYRLRLLLQDPVSATARQASTAFEVR